METIKEAGIENGCDRVVGNLMYLVFVHLFIFSYNVATTVPTSAVQYRPALVKLIMEKKVKTNLQISEAVAYLKKLPANATVCLFSYKKVFYFQLDQSAFETACGSGIEVSDEEIAESVAALIEKNKEALIAQRYCFPINQLMYATKEGRMKWADGKKVKDVLDASILSLLGEKTQADLDVIRHSIRIDYLQAIANSKKKGKKETKKEQKVETVEPEVEKEKEVGTPRAT